MAKLFAAVFAAFEVVNSDCFVAEAARILGELNAIHRFREGNGRSQLTFMAMLGESCGYPLDFSCVNRNTFMPAMIASYRGDLAPLRAELTALLD